jgi:CBS domain-containing protein
MISRGGDTSILHAARLMLRNTVGGTPVIDARGSAGGIVGVRDFLAVIEVEELADQAHFHCDGRFEICPCRP